MGQVLEERFESADPLADFDSTSSSTSGLSFTAAAALEGSKGMEVLPDGVTIYHGRKNFSALNGGQYRVGILMNPNRARHSGGADQHFAFLRGNNHFQMEYRNTSGTPQLRMRYLTDASGGMINGDWFNLAGGEEAVYKLEVEHQMGSGGSAEWRFYVDGQSAWNIDGIDQTLAVLSSLQVGKPTSHGAEYDRPIHLDHLVLRDDHSPIFGGTTIKGLGSGLCAGTSGATGTLQRKKTTGGSGGSTSDATGSLARRRALNGSGGSTSDASGDIFSQPLIGSGASVSGATGTLARKRELAGLLVGSSSGEGKLREELGIMLFSDAVRQRIHLPRQAGPWLELYEVDVPDGTVRRYCDYVDPDRGGSLPNLLPFNGNEYEAISISRSPYGSDADGARQRWTLTVADPRFEGAALLRRHSGLRGQKVRIYLIPEDLLDDPANAVVSEGEVISSTITQAPNSITLQVGHFDLFGAVFPPLTYSKGKCRNSWQDRFIPGNACSYPSNHFGPSRRQNYRAGGTNAVKARKHGWWTQQALQSSVFESGSGQLLVSTSSQDIRWEDDRRNGPNLFRTFSSFPWDIHTSVSLIDTSRPDWFVGLVAQGGASAAPDDPDQPSTNSTWLAWGLAPGGVLRRQTAQNASADAFFAGVYTRLRIRRVSSGTWELYAKRLETDGWDLLETVTLELSGFCRVGAFVSADSFGNTSTLAVGFDYLQFTEGGFETCGRNPSDCDERQNRIEFGGVLSMPDAVS